MADINQIISVGIGSPSGIPEFLLFGLTVRVVATPTCRTFGIGIDSRTFGIAADSRVYAVEC